MLDDHPSLKSNCNIVQFMSASIGRIPVKKAVNTTEPTDSTPVMKDD